MSSRQKCTAHLFIAGCLTGCGTAADSVATNAPPPPAPAELIATDSKAAAQDPVKPLEVGELAPDFAVEALGGKTLRLSEHLALAAGPTIVLFNRAHW